MAGRGRPKGSLNRNGPAEDATLIKWTDPELLKEIEELARVEERSVPAMCRYLIRKGIEVMQKQKMQAE